MPIPSLERTATDKAAWVFRAQVTIVLSRTRRLRRRRPAQLKRKALQVA